MSCARTISGDQRRHNSYIKSIDIVLIELQGKDIHIESQKHTGSQKYTGTNSLWKSRT